MTLTDDDTRLAAWFREAAEQIPAEGHLDDALGGSLTERRAPRGGRAGWVLAGSAAAATVAVVGIAALATSNAPGPAMAERPTVLPTTVASPVTAAPAPLPTPAPTGGDPGLGAPEPPPAGFPDEYITGPHADPVPIDDFADESYVPSATVPTELGEFTVYDHPESVETCVALAGTDGTVATSCVPNQVVAEGLAYVYQRHGSSPAWAWGLVDPALAATVTVGEVTVTPDPSGLWWAPVPDGVSDYSIESSTLSVRVPMFPLAVAG